MTIDATTAVGELVLKAPGATRILERWNIDYSRTGALTLQQACESSGIDTSNMIASLNAALAPKAEQPDWNVVPLRQLIRHILENHHLYTRQECDALQELSKKVATRHGETHPETIKLAGMVYELAQELLQHMYKEEQILFPYVEALDAAIETGDPRPMPFFGTAMNPIRMMMAEHEMVDVMLAQMRALTGDYELPEDACLSYTALYRRLQDLDADVQLHVYLENEILFPRTLQAEGLTRGE